MLAVEIPRSYRLLQPRIGVWGHCHPNAIRSEVQRSGIDRPEAEQHRKALPGDSCLLGRFPAYVLNNLLGGCQIFGAAEQKWVDWLPEPCALGAAEYKYRETREREKLPDAGRGFCNLHSAFEAIHLPLRKVAGLEIGTDAIEIHLPAHYQASGFHPAAFGCA